MSFRQTATLLSQKSKSKSASWASRQIRDPYVQKRMTDPASYRARSAFKLIEINDQTNKFLNYPDVGAVVDLGAAPGGWSQVVAEKFGWGSTTDVIMPLTRNTRWERENASDDTSSSSFGEDKEDVDMMKRMKRKKQTRGKAIQPELQYFDPLNIDDMKEDIANSHGRGTIISVDLLKIERIPGVRTIQGNFMHESTTKLFKTLLLQSGGGKADVILSDMAANVSGNDTHDIQSSLEICEAVFSFSELHLRSAEEIGRRRGGVLLMKFFAHPLLEKFRDERLQPNFNFVSYIKPDSSRATSREGYYLCQGWKPRQ